MGEGGVCYGGNGVSRSGHNFNISLVYSFYKESMLYWKEIERKKVIS